MTYMATTNLQVELLEKNLFIEVEAEETMAFSTLISKLKIEKHLNPDEIYFIKTPSGMPVNEEVSISFYKEKNFIVTENVDWKSPAMRSVNLIDIPEISAELILNDNKYWVLPAYTGVIWENDDLQTQLFCLNNVLVPGGKVMSLNLLVQYSLVDAILSGSKQISDRTIKMRQILVDALNIELAVNNITENNFFDNLPKLSGKMQYYLTSHMELKWATKIYGVSIVAFREFCKEV